MTPKRDTRRIHGAEVGPPPFSTNKTQTDSKHTDSKNTDKQHAGDTQNIKKDTPFARHSHKRGGGYIYIYVYIYIYMFIYEWPACGGPKNLVCIYLCT